MDIRRENWAQAAGSYVEDARGERFRIVGFIDRPAVILDPDPPQAYGVRQRVTLVLGSPLSDGYQLVNGQRDLSFSPDGDGGYGG